MSKPDYVKIRSLLEQYDLNPQRIRIEGMTDEGFFYVKEYRDGRPMYVPGQYFKLATEWTEWPNKELAKAVTDAYFGPDKIVDTVVENVKPTAKKVAPKAAPKKETNETA